MVKNLLEFPSRDSWARNRRGFGQARSSFTTRAGWIMLGTGAALMVAGVLWARKIVQVDV